MSTEKMFHVKQFEPEASPKSAGTAAPTTPPGEFSVFPTAGELAQLREKVVSGEERFKELVRENPLESLLALVGGGALVYYLAERGKNERVQNLADALEFTTTCASVGYSNIFPETALGSLVASAIFLFGPALTAQALDPVGGAGVKSPGPQPSGSVPASPAPTGSAADQRAILERLDAIVSLLKRKGE